MHWHCVGLAILALVGCASPAAGRSAMITSPAALESSVRDQIDEPTRFVALPNGKTEEIPAGMSDEEAFAKLGFPSPAPPPEEPKSTTIGALIAAQLLAGIPFAIWARLRRQKGFQTKARKLGFYGFALPAWQSVALLITAFLLPLTADQSINRSVGFAGAAVVLGLFGLVVGVWQDRKTDLSQAVPPTSLAMLPAGPNSGTGHELVTRHLQLSEAVKIALILGVVILFGVWASIYYSPYRECVRAKVARGNASIDWDGIRNTPGDIDGREQAAKIWCARNT